jgi:hypothetical protein
MAWSRQAAVDWVLSQAAALSKSTPAQRCTNQETLVDFALSSGLASTIQSASSVRLSMSSRRTF